jgi:hypothetical protein
VQTFNIVGRKKRCLEEHGAHNVTHPKNHALSFTILHRRVRTRHAEEGAIGEEEGPSRRVVNPMVIVALDTFDGTAKLGHHIREEISQKSFRLQLHGERPQKNEINHQE